MSGPDPNRLTFYLPFASGCLKRIAYKRFRINHSSRNPNSIQKNVLSYMSGLDPNRLCRTLSSSKREHSFRICRTLSATVRLQGRRTPGRESTGLRQVIEVPVESSPCLHIQPRTE